MPSRLMLSFSAAGIVGVLAVSGCGLAYVQKTSDPNNVIMSPEKARTEKGRAFARAHHDEMLAVYQELHAVYNSPQANFIINDQIPFAIGALGSLDNSGDIYFGALIATGDVYNTLRTNYNQRVSTAFAHHARRILGALLAQKGVFADPDVKGAAILISVAARDFSVSPDFGGQFEGIRLYCKKEDCNAFMQNQISNQEFIRRSQVIGFQGNNDLGRVEIDLKDTL